MKTFLAFVLAFISLALPVRLFAHSLQTDGSIGAVLHVDPNDSPVVGEESSFYFEFKDTSKKFDPRNCSCRAFILKADEEIFSTELFANNSAPSLTSSSFTYTFSEKSVYTVKVAGSSKNGSFSAFNLSFDLRVDRESTQNNPSFFEKFYHYWHYGLYILAGIIGIGLFAYERKKSKIPLKKSKEEENVKKV